MSTIAPAQRYEGMQSLLGELPANLMHESKSCRNIMQRDNISKQFHQNIPADVESQVAANTLSSASFTSNVISPPLQSQKAVPEVPISAWEHLLRTTEAPEPLHPERVCKNTSGMQILLGIDFDKPGHRFNPLLANRHRQAQSGVNVKKYRPGTSFSRQSAATRPNKKPRTKRSATKPSSKAKVTCGVCFEVLSSRKSMLKHQRTHANWKEARFQCGFCNAPFNDVDELKRHRERHMALEKPYLCLKCERPFSTRKSLMNHKRTHAPGSMAM